MSAESGMMSLASSQRCPKNRGIAIPLLLLIYFVNLVTLHRSVYFSSFNLIYYPSGDEVALPSSDVPSVADYSTATAAEQTISSETLPIYLIDTSNKNQTNIAASTWGNIASHWNRTTQFSNLLNAATSVPSLPNQYDSTAINSKKRRQIIVIHTGPKLGSTTLREACREYMKNTCPHIVSNWEKSYPFGYFGGEPLVSAMDGCVDTHYFCAKNIQVWDMLPSTTTVSDRSEAEEPDMSITKSVMQKNVEYIHLFPFRNYNDWVKSAIKQSHDRAELSAGRKKAIAACHSMKKKWDDECKHSGLEIDIRKYPRVDLDRFQDGVVRRMKSYYDANFEEGGGETHTFLLYLHKDLERTMEEISNAYNLPRLPGTGSKLKGERPDGTCDESVENLYHECFSDELMTFRWDLPENQLRSTRVRPN